MFTLLRFVLTSPRSSGPRYDPIGRHDGSRLYAVLAVWLLGAPDGVKQAALVGVAFVTAAALVGRTRRLWVAAPSVPSRRPQRLGDALERVGPALVGVDEPRR